MTTAKMAFLTAVLSAVSMTASAEDAYRFIKSGDPVAAASLNSCAAVSPGTALVSGALSRLTASGPLDSRFRTWRESVGTSLRSDMTGMMIFVR